MAFCDSDLTPILWSQQVQCSLPFGKCINNECVCEKGFSHDLYITRYRDCKVPDYFLVSIDSISIILTILSLIYCCVNIKPAKNLARRIIQSAALMNVFFLLFLILKTYDNHVFTGKALFFFQLFLSFLFLCWYLIVYSLILPICKIMQLPIQGRKLAMTICFVFFRVISIIVVGILSAGVVYNGRKIISEIKELEDAPTSSKPYGDYKERVQMLVETHKVQLNTLLLGLTCPIIQFATGYVPYSYALFSLVQLTCPFVSFKFASFAVINKNIGQLSDKPNASTRNEIHPVKHISTTMSHNQQSNQQSN